MSVPAEGTVERWAWEYLFGTTMALKLDPPPRPRVWEEAPPVRRVEAPGRPPELRLATRRHKPMGKNALERKERRIELVHTFLHHELQAAELMAWALLAFPDTPRAFRVGLLGVLDDEARHMRLYQAYLAGHGTTFGDLPVRDWFWERLPTCTTARAFVATMGMGFEAGNLDHTRRFAERLRAAGDASAAAMTELVGEEEIPHVRFAMRWYVRFGGDARFAGWRADLPPPL
ncbi:hypothetical protein BH09MYX1_BH09MYX1_22150 [soil metagenome]